MTICCLRPTNSGRPAINSALMPKAGRTGPTPPRLHFAYITVDAGDTSQTVRDIIQAKLLGPVGAFGTGLIRKELIVRTTARQGIPDAVQDIYVTHTSGGTSSLTLKSYDQKRLSFQGTGKHVIWLDEEPDLGVYSECLLRTMTTNGLVMCTFTPMLGLSEVVMNYLPEGRMPL